MDLDGLIAQFRREADDKVAPYLWSDEDVTAWLDEAEEEAAIRACLIRETTDPAICQVAVTAEQAGYTLHEKVLHVTHAQFQPAGDTARHKLDVVTREMLDKIDLRWRERAPGVPRYLVHEPNQAAVLVPPPAIDGTLALEVQRLPLQSMDLTGAPEIGSAHHRHLVDWALFKAFSKPDAETIDKDRAVLAEGRFNAYFGLRRDAHLGRDHAADRPHHNTAIW